MEEHKCKNNNRLVTILALLLILSSATSMYLYFNNHNFASQPLSNQQETIEIKSPEELLRQVNDESKAIDEKITKVDKETDFDPKTDDIKTIVKKIDLLIKEFSQE